MQCFPGRPASAAKGGGLSWQSDRAETFPEEFYTLILDNGPPEKVEARRTGPRIARALATMAMVVLGVIGGVILTGLQAPDERTEGPARELRTEPPARVAASEPSAREPREEPSPPVAASEPPSPPRVTWFEAPDGCALQSDPEPAPAATDLISTCGFVAPNGNIRLLEIRRQELDLTQLDAELEEKVASADWTVSTMLEIDAPQPDVVRLSGYEILSYEAGSVQPAELPDGFFACIRATEIRGEIGASQPDAVDRTAAAPEEDASQWTERRYGCRALAPAQDRVVDIHLILREGHAPGGVSGDFDGLAGQLFRSLKAFPADEPAVSRG
jgi:hypothetical protein